MVKIKYLLLFLRYTILLIVSLLVTRIDAAMISQSPVCPGIVDSIVAIKNPNSKLIILHFTLFNLYKVF